MAHHTNKIGINSMDQSSSWEADSMLSKSRNSLPFMEPEGSLLYSQELTTDPCPEPDESISHHQTLIP
jgi:hypothetical protein